MSKKENEVNDEDWDSNESGTDEAEADKPVATVLRVERYALDNNIGKVKARAIIRKQDLLAKVGTLKAPITAKESVVITREILTELVETLL